MVKSIEGITVTLTDGNIEIDDNESIWLSAEIPTVITDIISQNKEVEPFDFDTVKIDCECECNNQLRVYDTGAIEIIDDENNWIFSSVSMGTASAIAKEVATWSK